MGLIETVDLDPARELCVTPILFRDLFLSVVDLFVLMVELKPTSNQI
tara:strand:+ start:364 stop:504 length:141 start_codon:yes stop_codon:yes gene_type:complete